MRIRFDAGAQCRDATVNAARGHDDRMSPDGVQNIVAGESAAASRNEIRQEPKFLGREPDFAIVTKQLMRPLIQFEFTEAEDFSLSGARSPQKRIHSGDQLSDAEWLGNVIIGAKIQTENDIFLLSLRGEHQNRNLDAALANGTANFITIDAWQHDVEENQIRLLLQREIDSCRAILRRQNFEAFGPKRIFQSAHERGFVFNDQDATSVQAAAVSVARGCGRHTLNVLPAPGRLATRTVPPCARTIDSTMLRPSPQPPVSLARRESI